MLHTYNVGTYNVFRSLFFFFCFSTDSFYFEWLCPLICFPVFMHRWPLANQIKVPNACHTISEAPHTITLIIVRATQWNLKEVEPNPKQFIVQFENNKTKKLIKKRIQQIKSFTYRRTKKKNDIRKWVAAKIKITNGEQMHKSSRDN